LENFWGVKKIRLFINDNFMSNTILSDVGFTTHHKFHNLEGGVIVESYPHGVRRYGPGPSVVMIKVGLEGIDGMDCKTIFAAFGPPQQPVTACVPLTHHIPELQGPFNIPPGAIGPYWAPTRQEMENRTIKYVFSSRSIIYNLRISTNWSGSVRGIELEAEEQS
jgi:hypothetical protein